jgi:hypothetical protein
MLKEDEKLELQTEISNGVVATNADIRKSAYPLNLRSRAIIRWFRSVYDGLYEKTQYLHLNWPDIHRHYWEKFDDAIEADTNEKCLAIENVINEFNEEILTQLENVAEVQGVRIFNELKRR